MERGIVLKLLRTQSIRSQFFRSYLFFIVILVGVVIICNFLFLEKFYVSQKLKELEEMTHHFEEKWEQNDIVGLAKLIQELENRYSAVIEFQNASQQNIYSTRLYRPQLNKYTFPYENSVEVPLTEEDVTRFSEGKMVTFQTKNRTPDMQVIGVTKKFSDGEVILTHVTVESIQESVKLMNQFILCISMMLFIFGWFWSKSYADRFTRPILTIKGMSESLSRLDFSARWKEQRKDELGELGETMNTLSDILDTSIQEIRKQNEQLEAELKRKDALEQMRKAFISDVSHELKTPIALIQGYAEGLLYDINQDSKNKEEYCQVIVDEAKQMSSLVNDLLFISKLESGVEPLNVESFKISPLVSNVCEKLETILSPDVHVDMNIPDIEISGDYRKIERVLTNLMTNAYKYVNEKGIIRMNAVEKGDKLRVQIYNSCDNMQEEELEKIWLSFYKIDKSRNREAALSSTGLGLSIVKKLMDLHKEACGARNIEDGVEFWFELPITKRL